MKMAKEKLAAFNARCTFQVHCGIQNQVSDKSKNIRSRSLRKYVVVILCLVLCATYDPLMMSQKEAPMGAYQKSSLFGVNSQPLFDNYGCFMGVSFCCCQYIVGSTQEEPIIFYKAKLNRNSNNFSYFSRKHPCVLPGCFLL